MAAFTMAPLPPASSNIKVRLTASKPPLPQPTKQVTTPHCLWHSHHQVAVRVRPPSHREMALEGGVHGKC